MSGELCCPICSEQMVTLAQLNQHIDDAHSGERLDTTNLSPPVKKSIELDLHDGSLEFGLSDTRRSPEQTGTCPGDKLTRRHWQHPLSGGRNICRQKHCGKSLNVKNGVVNCRKCGRLFCNQHTGFVCRLANGVAPDFLPQYSVNKEGVFVRCCERCFVNKPLFRAGTRVGGRELTDQFFKARRKAGENRVLARESVQRRFIKLVNLLASDFLWHYEHRRNVWQMVTAPAAPFTRESMLEAQKAIVGVDNWQHDEDVTHCPICFSRFSFLIRKHHCRLCGTIVLDSLLANDTPATACSLEIPVAVLMERLPHLNYSRHVTNNWLLILNSADPARSPFATRLFFRCCRTCKNALLQGVGLSPSPDPSSERLFAVYGDLLVIKHSILAVLPRYGALISDNNAPDNTATNILRVRLVKHLKDFEIGTKDFRQEFFRYDAASSSFSPTVFPTLTTNIYKSIVVFLQESLVEFKQYNEKFSANEKARLAGQLGVDPSSGGTSLSPTPALGSPASPAKPTLTKKEIREMREELMVVNEQKFLVEQQIESAKQLRRLDEVQALGVNVGELEKRIAELDEALGEFAFE